MSTQTTRERMIETADRLFRRQGYHATSWRTLVEEAGTPWGSIQHHFPGGKQELGIAAMELGHEQALAFRASCFERAGSVPAGIRLWFDKVAVVLERSGWEIGCPVATIALETASSSPALAAACARAFERSEASLADALAGAGIPRRRARALATTILARVARSREPLELAGKQYEALVAAEAGAAP